MTCVKSRKVFESLHKNDKSRRQVTHSICRLDCVDDGYHGRHGLLWSLVALAIVGCTNGDPSTSESLGPDTIWYNQEEIYVLASLTEEPPSRTRWKSLEERRSHPAAGVEAINELSKWQQKVFCADLSGVTLSSDIRSNWSRLGCLKWLAMPMQLDSDDVAWMAKQQNIVGLSLCGSKVTGGDFGAMIHMKRLEWVLLTALDCPEDIIKTWPRIMSLREIDLSRNGQAMQWLRHFSELRLANVVGLSIAESVVEDAEFEIFLDTCDPSWLNLRDAKRITDASIEAVIREPRLRSIWVGGSGITWDGVSAIRAQRRDVTVYDSRDK